MNPTVRCASAALVLALIFVGADWMPLAAQQQQRQPSGPDFTQPYLLLGMNRSSTMDKELNEAARAGYRVMAAWYPKGEEVILLKKTDGTGDAVEYKVLDPWDAADLEKQLKAAAAVGYRLVPRTITVSTTEFSKGRGRIRALTARAAGATERYEYSVGVATGEMKSRLLADFEPGGPLKKDVIEREMQRLAEAGYSLVDLLPRMDGKEKRPGLLNFKEGPSKDLEIYLVGERLAGSTDPLPPADRYRRDARPPVAGGPPRGDGGRLSFGAHVRESRS